MAFSTKIMTRSLLNAIIPLIGFFCIINVSCGSKDSLAPEVEEEKTATYESLTPATAESGERIVISGKNLRQIVAVVYPGEVKDASFSVSRDGSRLTTTVPDETFGGAITLIDGSGRKIRTDEFVYPSVTCVGVEPGNAKIGDVIKISGSRLDKVREVRFSGENVVQKDGWSLNEDASELSIAVPEGTESGPIRLVQNTFIAATTEAVTILPADKPANPDKPDKPEDKPDKPTDNPDDKPGDNPGDKPSEEPTVTTVTLWEGAVAFDGEWGSRIEITADKLASVNEGTKLQFNYELDASSAYWQLKPMDGNWNALSYNYVVDPLWQCITLGKGTTETTVQLTVSDVKALRQTGLVVCGCWLKLKKVTAEIPNQP